MLITNWNNASLYQYLERIKYADRVKYKFLKKLIKFYLKVAGEKKILFIFGVQRSGTTITIDFLMKLFGVKGYHEFSALTADGDEELRFPSNDAVKKRINENQEPFVLVKPLVESQMADIVLRDFENSVGIWMYRNYKDVISSFHKKFGENVGEHHIDLIIRNVSHNWRAERVPDHLRQLAIDFKNKGMTNYDSTALYWYIRNMLFFEYEFENISTLKVLKYEYFMNNYHQVTKKICRLWGYTFELPEDKFVFRTDSIKKGKNIEINPEIEKLCQEVLDKFDEVFIKQNYFAQPS